MGSEEVNREWSFRRLARSVIRSTPSRAEGRSDANSGSRGDEGSREALSTERERQIEAPALNLGLRTTLVPVLIWVLRRRAHSQSIISGSFGLFLDGLSCSTRAGGSQTSGTPRRGFSIIAAPSTLGSPRFAVLRVAHLAQQ